MHILLMCIYNVYIFKIISKYLFFLKLYYNGEGSHLKRKKKKSPQLPNTTTTKPPKTKLEWGRNSCHLLFMSIRFENPKLSSNPSSPSLPSGKVAAFGLTEPCLFFENPILLSNPVSEFMSIIFPTQNLFLINQLHPHES